MNASQGSRWRIIWAIARKDMLDAIKNTYILVGLLMPLGMSLLFRVVFAPSGDMTLTIAVYDPGNSQLVQRLEARPDVELVRVGSPEALQAEVRKDAIGGLVILPGFDAAVAADQRPELQVYLNGRRGGGGVAAFQRLVEREVWGLVGREFPAQITTLDVMAAEGSLTNLQHYFLILLVVMGLTMSGIFVVPTLIVEEKEKHTLKALLVSPATEGEVVAGKALTGLAYSLVGAGLLLLLNGGWQGNWPLTVFGVVLGALLLVGVGLLLGGLFQTMAQVNTWASLLMLLFMLPSWIIVITPPAALVTVVRLIPTYYLADLLQSSLSGSAIGARLVGHLAILAATAALAFAGVVWLLRRDEA